MMGKRLQIRARRSTASWIAVGGLLLLASKALAASAAPPIIIKNPDGRARESFIVEAKNGAVVADHILASKAGIEVLRAGGNAADAFVATSFAISVLRPQSTGLGGGGFALHFDSKSRATEVFDFRERAPEAARVDMFLNAKGEIRETSYNGNAIKRPSVNGHLAVGTPGVVAGVVELHKKHGTLPLKRLLKAAIEIAETGFEVYPSLARSIERRKDTLAKFEGSAQLFLPKGKPLKAGEMLVQKDLAATLRRIADKGKDGFYKGKTRELILQEIKAGKGILSGRDLDAYTVKMREPISGNFRGYRVKSMPPPSSGGVHIVQMLNMLGKDDFRKMGHNSRDAAHLIGETMKRAFADRAKYLGDADFVQVPLSKLVSLDYAKKLRASISASKATPARSIQNPSLVPKESKSTTHFSIVDRWGNAVSTTQTVNFGFGSGVVARGTGVVLNDEMDDFSIKPGVPNAFGLVGNEQNAIAAGKTMLSSMSPSLVFDPSGRLDLIVGAPGGPTILTATFQTILNTIAFDMNLPDAVHAARIHHQWLPDVLRFEKDGLKPGVEKALSGLGHKLKATNFPIGKIQAIRRNGKGWIGVSDTRSDGRPLAY